MRAVPHRHGPGRDYRSQRPVGRAGAGGHRRDGRRRGDLPPRRLLRHHDVRQDAGDRRRQRRDPVAVHTLGVRLVGGIVPDDDRDARRRSRPGTHLRGLARRQDPEAHRSGRPGRLEHRDHHPPPAREDRVAAQVLPRARDRHHRRLHRRCVTLSGTRGGPGRGERPTVARVELALQRPAGVTESGELPGERLRHLGPRRGGHRFDTGSIFVATGNGPWDGRSDGGDAVLELDSSATQLLGNYTPVNTAELEASDADLGSTSPVLLGGNLIVQGGKDGSIKLLDWRQMKGTAPHRGGERQVIPSGAARFTAPAVLRTATATSLFAADNGGTAAWTLGDGELRPLWRNGNSGTSPVAAGGLLFVYDPGGGLRVYDPATGRELAKLECGGGHWNSPVVADGRIALPEGNSNDRATSGIINIWRLP